MKFGHQMDLPSDILREIILYSNIETLKSFRLCSRTVLNTCSDYSFWSNKYERDRLWSLALVIPSPGVQRLNDYIRSRDAIRTVKLAKALIEHLTDHGDYNIYVKILRDEIYLDTLLEPVRIAFNDRVDNVRIDFCYSGKYYKYPFLMCYNYFDINGICIFEYEVGFLPEESCKFDNKIMEILYYHPKCRLVSHPYGFPLVLRDLDDQILEFKRLGLDPSSLNRRKQFLESEIARLGE